MLLKKEGVKPNKGLVKSIAKKVNSDIKSNNQKNDYKNYLSLRESFFVSLKKMKNGPEKWFLGMIITNMPKYSLQQFINVGGLQSLLSQGPLGFFVNYYTTGKIDDAVKKNNYDLLKAIKEPFIKFYGYSNINNVWGSENWKILLEYVFGIDKNGNMSIGDYLLNSISILFSFGLGAIITKLGKTGLTSLSKILPKTILTSSTQFFTRLSSLTKNIGEKILPKAISNIFSDYSIKKGIVDVSKFLSGDYTAVLKQLTKIPQLKGIGPLVDAINIYTKGAPGLIGFMNKNVLIKIRGLSKIATFSNYRSDINSVKKGINSSISYVNNIINSVKTTVKSKANAIKSTAKKIYSTIKSGVTKLYNTFKSGVTKIYNTIMSFI